MASIEEVEEMLAMYEDTFQETKANRCRSKLDFLIYMENRSKPRSDGPNYRVKFDEY